MVHLRTIDPSIEQDIRYAGPNNFVGRPLLGYGAGECILRKGAAQALARVQADLARRTPALTLRVYDCYRPVRATRDMVRWSQAAESVEVRRAFHPDLARRSLFARGYISERSGHNRGAAVDLTIALKRPTGAAAASDAPPSKAAPLSSAPCAEPESDGTMDMGTGFDCFDAKSHTYAAGLSPAQRSARATLVEAMARHGFRNYAREWWHFTHAGDDGESHDLPIAAAPSQPSKLELTAPPVVVDAPPMPVPVPIPATRPAAPSKP